MDCWKQQAKAGMGRRKSAKVVGKYAPTKEEGLSVEEWRKKGVDL